jgi:hypothetical protein
MHKMPLGVGRFIGETSGQSSETSKFYRSLERIGAHKSALEEMKDAGDGAAMREYLAANPDAKMVQMADKASREIGYLRRQKRELIEKGANKERVKMIDDKITGMTRRYNEVLSPLNLARAFELAIELGANIIHCAFCRPTQTGEGEEILVKAIKKCIDNNILIVSPTGNNLGECWCMPAVLPGTLAVGAAKFNSIRNRHTKPSTECA